MSKLAILDGYAMNKGDLNWERFKNLADDVVIYDVTPKDKTLLHIGDADYVILNKVYIGEEQLKNLPNLKWIGITATGTDSLDVNACAKYNIPVANVPAYSTNSVAQLAFALILELFQSVGAFNASVQGGQWRLDIDKKYNVMPQRELFGKTLGIIGYGDIGKTVANIAQAFGMQVLCHTRTVKPEYKSSFINFVSFDELLYGSDIISLHCPSTPQTRGMINKEAIAKMKNGVYLVNTARGLLVDDAAVAQALYSGKLAGFGADVVSIEPMQNESPFFKTPNTIITPHIAWATRESLDRLLDCVYNNLHSYLNGVGENIVNM